MLSRERGLDALTRITDATPPAEKAAAIAFGARSFLDARSASVLLFIEDQIVTAHDPPDAAGFALRDESSELRRLFLHAIARYGDGPVFVTREQQGTLAGMTPCARRDDLIFVPLVNANETIGVLVLAVDAAPDRELLDGLRTYAALAARLYQMQRAVAAARRQSRDSRLLAMVNERLHRSLDRRDVLFGIVEGVRNAFGAERCAVYQRLAEDEMASVAAAAIAPAAESLPAQAIPLDADLRKAFGGLTVRRAEMTGSIAFGAEARSAVAVPFVVDGSVDDVLVLSFDRPQAFDDADVAALRSLAFHVGLALSNARLYTRERARRRQAESLERVARILRDTQYVDEVLLVFVVTVSHELPVDCAAYALDGDMLTRRAVRTREQHSKPFPEQLDRRSFEPFLAVDEPSEAMLLPRVVRGEIFDGHSGVLVPLMLDGNVWGMFLVRDEVDDADWQREERTGFFRTLGSHLEIALANARAYERELQRSQERQTLAEAARTILSHPILGPLADVMCRLAASLVHTDRAAVWRWTGERYRRIGEYGEGLDEAIERSGFDLSQRVERSEGPASDERRQQRLIEGPGFAVIPLMRTSAEDSAETIDAFLFVGGPYGARFGREELRLLQELGALLALALRNIELYEAMQRANVALQESSEFKDDLLAMLAHDFKGPLTVILGYCDLLLEGDEDRRGEIEMIHAQTQRLVRLSDDALVLAQTQAEGFSLARTVVDLSEFVVTAVRAGAPNESRIVFDSSPERIYVDLDPQRFRHVLDNLISNALKYSSGEVVVRVYSEGKEAKVEVVDRGIGIPSDDFATLFTRFGRASNARRRGIAGSGIGLYVARKIVDVHRGSLNVRSKEDEGSTFIVTLPLAAP